MPSCRQEPSNLGPKYQTVTTRSNGVSKYKFAVHPLHNPAELTQEYQPLLDYLNRKLPHITLELEASRDYADYEAKLAAGSLHFLLPNPWQTLQAMDKNYLVIAMAGEPSDFRGIFIVRKDSGIHHHTDLIGKSISYPAPTALAACIMPQYYLHEQGLDITTDIQNHYVGSQESAIMNAYLRETAAAATWPPPWREFQKDHPGEAKELTLIWETKPLINNSVMVRRDIPEKLTRQVRELLLELKDTAEGRIILQGMETAGFFQADNATYDIVRRYIANFEKDVRKVK